MKTTEKKKHKGGYELLKEKYAKLEAELAQAESARNNYSAQLDRSRTDVHNLNIEVKELKEKYAKLEKERDKLKEELSMQIAPDFETFKRVEKERDEWKAKYEQKCASAKLFENETTRLHGIIEEADKRIAFLLDHCPFWVRWMYRKQFEKGGN